MSNPPVTLVSLTFDWGDAYVLSSARDRWAATRRDGRYCLAADTLGDLEELIIADYRRNPVAREYDPPDAGGYLDDPGLLALFTQDAPVSVGNGDAQHLANDLGPELAVRLGLCDLTPASNPDHAGADNESQHPDDGERFLLAALREAFPAWTIEHSTQLRAWTARTRKTTICQGSLVLLCAALLLTERRYWRQADGYW